MTKMGAFLVAVLPVATFALGAWVEDVRMRQHYIDEGNHQGRVSEIRDAFGDSVMIYLHCLSDHCERQHEDYRYTSAWADASLQKLGEPKIDGTK